MAKLDNLFDPYESSTASCEFLHSIESAPLDPIDLRGNGISLDNDQFHGLNRDLSSHGLSSHDY